MVLASLCEHASGVRHRFVVLLPWAFCCLVGRSRQQKFNPVFKPVPCKNENYLVKLFSRNSFTSRPFPKGIPQLVWISHVIVNISPHHQSGIGPHSQADPKFGWRSLNQTVSAAAIDWTDYVVSGPGPNPSWIYGLDKRANKNRIDATALFAFVQAYNMGAARHAPTPLRWPRPQ